MSEQHSANPHDLPMLDIIKDALAEHHYYLVYQPQFSLCGGELKGFEALVRCHSPRFGLISPADFIPVAEESGDIVKLGRWITRQALFDLKKIREASGLNLYMSINVSPRQFQAGDVYENFMQNLIDMKLPAEALKLELTETALIQNPGLVARTFKAFQQDGVKIWLDDFGTGFASLNLLRVFKIDGLKIDKSFVDGLSSNEDDFTICSAILAMAQRLGLSTVAEGVETDSQLQILSQLGCDSVQGYLTGKPTVLDQCSRFWSPEHKGQCA